jgi:hypothetical protein
LATCTSKRIYRRGRTWYLDLRWSDGRRERRSAGGTKAQAERLAQNRIRAEANVAGGNPANWKPAPGPPFDTLAERYLEHLRIYGKPASVDAAERSLKQLTGYFWDTDAATITGADVDGFVAHR